MNTSAPPDLQACVDRLNELRVFPAAALRVLAIMRDPEASIVDVEVALEADPTLAAQALSIANSAAFSRKVPVRTLGRAVKVLGLKSTRDLVLSVIVGNIASQRAPWGPYMHRHALLCATISRNLAARTPYVDANEAYVVGLLHDLGLQLLLRLDPEATEQLLERCGMKMLEKAEKIRFGFTHAELSAMCMHSWSLPASVIQVVSNHHQAVKPSKEHAPHLVLSVADELSDLLSDGAGSLDVFKVLKTHPVNRILRLPEGVLRQLAEQILDDASAI